VSPYKDKGKQREANKERMRRVRQGNTEQGNTENKAVGNVLPEDDVTPYINHRVVFSDDGAVLDLDIIERKREKLTLLINYMNSEEKFKRYMKDIRFGVSGTTLDRVGVAMGLL